MDQKQIDSLKQFNDLLSQFITRLSRFYEGASSNIDSELQVLRGHLSGKQNVTLATISIKKLNNLLMQNSKDLKKHTTDKLSQLEKAVKKLQQTENIPENLRTETAKFLSSLSQQTANAFSTLPQFEQAISLFQKAVENSTNGQSDQSANRDMSKPSKNSSDTTQPHPLDERLHANISMELQQLIEPYYQKNQSDPQLRDVRTKLLDGLSQQELLECCLILIRLIVKDAVREAGVNNKVIDSLHKSIVNINRNVDETIDITKAHISSKVEISETLQTQLDDMGDIVNDSDDLETLKSEAQSYLEKIKLTLDQKKDAEREEEQTLIALLQNMQRELTSMQNKTQQYQRKLLEQKHQAQVDPLTKVPNRVAYNERIKEEYERWKRSHSPLCMALIDIDHFKSINDQYGHAAGDKTLQVIAKQLRGNLRKTDFLARWGGEEFVVLFTNTTLSNLIDSLDAIRIKLEKLPFKFKDKPVTITASFGVTEFQSDDTIENVFERADSYLYIAKNNGRNQVVSDLSKNK